MTEKIENVVITPEDKKFGVTLIEKAMDIIHNTADEVIDDFSNKKLELSEIFGLTDNVYSIVMIATKGDQLWDEITDIDTEEGQQLLAKAIAFGYLKEDAIKIVNHTVTIVLNIIEIIKLIKARNVIK